MRVKLRPAPAAASQAKDLILAVIGKIGIGGRHWLRARICRRGVRALSMEGRMTMCNMTIEGGARAGMVAPDETTIAYLEGRPFVPRGKAFQVVADYWRCSLAIPARGTMRKSNFTLRRSRRK